MSDTLRRDLLALAHQSGQVSEQDCLRRIDAAVACLASDLRVEYYGPEVGLGRGRHVYRLVVRCHRLGPSESGWGVWVCTALPHAGWRADWPLGGVSTLRRREVLKVLPQFFKGYCAAVAEAGLATSRAGRRLAELAECFDGQTQ